MGDFITDKSISDGVAPEYRHYLRVSSLPLPHTMQCIVEAFWTATRCIGPAMWFSHPAHVCFGAAPFSLTLGQGELVYRPHNPQTIGVHVEHLVFLDCNKLAPLVFPIQVACILEELVHALMHVRDEKLVSIIVASLYSGVTLVDGRYTPVAPVAPA